MNGRKGVLDGVGVIYFNFDNFKRRRFKCFSVINNIVVLMLCRSDVIAGVLLYKSLSCSDFMPFTDHSQSNQVKLIIYYFILFL